MAAASALLASNAECAQSAAKAGVLLWQWSVPSPKLCCIEAVWGGPTCAHAPAAIKTMRAALQHTAGVASMAAKCALDKFISTACFNFVVDWEYRRSLPPLELWLALRKVPPKALIEMLKKAGAVGNALVEHAFALRRRHPALSRRKLEAPPTDSGRNAVRAMLMNQRWTAPPGRRRQVQPVFDCVVRRSLGVKTRLPLWVKEALSSPADVYKIGTVPPLVPITPEFFRCYGLPAVTGPVSQWARSLSGAEKAVAHILVHANAHGRRLSVSWSASPSTPDHVVVCSSCISVCSCHPGLGGKRGVVIDPATGTVRCSKCGCKSTHVVPMTGKTLTLVEKSGPVAITACRSCGRLHQLSTGLCEDCSGLSPALCICRKPSRQPARPFVASVRGTHVLRWACQKHYHLLPPSVEPLEDLLTKLEIRQ